MLNPKKVCQEIIVMLFFFLCLITNAWSSIGEVNVTGYLLEENDPINYTQVTLNWGYAGGDTITSYYYKITESSEYSLTSSNGTQTTSESLEKLPLNDGSYYFYIAAYKSSTPPTFPPPEMGPVTKYGPIILDNQVPENVSVGPDANVTEDESITLEFGADESLERVCISESTYGVGCTWKGLSLQDQTCSYRLKQGEDVYTLYIQVEDYAGNVANADPYYVTFTTGDDTIMAQYTSVPTLSQWGIILFFSMLLMIALIVMRRAEFVVRK